MTKPLDAQATEVIRKRYEEDKRSWTEIAKELTRLGYISKRSGEPLEPMTVRYRYYADKKASRLTPNLQAQQQIDMIRKMLALKAEEKVKLALIQSVLDSE